MMKNVLHQKGWGTYTSPDHVDPSPILLIKETPDGKSDGDYVKLKMCGYPTSSMSELYEFRMSLFDYGNPEEFLLFVQNFKKNLVAT